MSTPSQNPRAVRELMQRLSNLDADLLDVESLIRADQQAGRRPRAEADRDIEAARDAHLRECRALRERYERGELGTDEIPGSES